MSKRKKSKVSKDLELYETYMINEINSITKSYIMEDISYIFNEEFKYVYAMENILENYKRNMREDKRTHLEEIYNAFYLSENDITIDYLVGLSDNPNSNIVVPYDINKTQGSSVNTTSSDTASTANTDVVNTASNTNTGAVSTAVTTNISALDTSPATTNTYKLGTSTVNTNTSELDTSPPKLDDNISNGNIQSVSTGSSDQRDMRGEQSQGTAETDSTKDLQTRRSGQSASTDNKPTTTQQGNRAYSSKSGSSSRVEKLKSILSNLYGGVSGYFNKVTSNPLYSSLAGALGGAIVRSLLHMKRVRELKRIYNMCRTEECRERVIEMIRNSSFASELLKGGLMGMAVGAGVGLGRKAYEHYKK